MDGRYSPRNVITVREFFVSLHTALKQAEGQNVWPYQTAFIVGLDGAVYDSSPRMAAILKSFIFEHLQRHQAFECLLSEVEAMFIERRTFYSPEDNWSHLVECACQFAHPERVFGLQSAWLEYWRERWYTNDGVLFDQLQPGVKRLLQCMGEFGIHIIYLTRRHHDAEMIGKFPDGMLKGTYDTFWRDGLSVQTIVNKPSFELDAAKFEADYFTAAFKGHRRVLGYLGSSPASVLCFRSAANLAGVVLPVTVYYQDSICDQPLDLPPDVFVLPNYTD